MITICVLYPDLLGTYGDGGNGLVVAQRARRRGIDVTLVEGAVSSQEDLAKIQHIRQRTRLLVALGDCAVTSNVPAMRNQFGIDNAENVLQRAYVENAQNNPSVPKADGIVPQLLANVVPVHEVVHVEYFLPGCPPPAARIKSLVAQLLAGTAPKQEGEQLKFG